MIRLAGISKSFGAVRALEAVSASISVGTIHAIVGENGAGKTTLMNVLYGALQPDQGAIELNGEPVKFASTAEALKRGIGMVSQHYAIIPELSCLQNLMLGAEGGGFLSLKRDKLRAQELAARMGFSFHWDAPAADLTPAGAQKLEILKLLWRNSKIMILDEPTAMLSPQDAGALFESLHTLVDEGSTVILVTHRLPEVMEHCDNVTVLREGKLVSETPVARISAAELARQIVGHSLPDSSPLRSSESRSPALVVRDLVARGYRGDQALKGVALTLYQGEILGIAGVDGSGQRELFRAILGLLKPDSGAVEIPGSRSRTAAERLAAGVRVIPEDRHSEGIVDAWSLEENATLGLQRFAPFADGGWIDPAARKSWAQQVAQRFSTKHGGLQMAMASLSGGNQQRFVAARALGFDPRIVLAFQPARGLDIGATAEVYGAIRQACDSGAAALVVSFELDELLEHADRILVMNRGVLSEPAPGQERDRDAIGRLMVSA